MFGKDKPIKRFAGPSDLQTVIGPDTVIQGTVSSKGAIRVDGKLEGGIAAASHLVIGENGEIQGDITAASVVVGGKVTGNIVTTASLEILSNAQIHGDLKTASLSIAEGASFEGNCTMTKEKDVIEMDVSSGGLKARR